MLDSFQYRILKRISPGNPNKGASVYEGKSKLAMLLGPDIFSRIAGKVVIDFGCGEGGDAVEMAQKGAKTVIGIDNREDVLQAARQQAAAKGVSDLCTFATSTEEMADVVISLDAFEHFGDPAAVLRIMSSLLKPGGEVHASFGPTWYHPLGGHLFSVFPWAHLLFSEKALIRWRSTFKTDGATRFSEIAGGLNQMTVARFRELVAASPFELADFEAVAIRKVRPFHNRLTREFFTSFVRARLIQRADTGSSRVTDGDAGSKKPAVLETVRR
jgi:SAM-dependent methyltransferase